MAGCYTIPSPDTFLSSTLAFFDCEAQTIGEQGYQALAAPGSSAMLLVTILLTLAVAFTGYRMLFGEAPTVREGVMFFVKVGIVLAFASGWVAYRTVVYDVVLRAPANLAAEIGVPAGVPGAGMGLGWRLDGVDRGLRTLAIYGVGVPTREQVETSNGIAPPLFAGFDAFALGSARLVFLVAALGSFALLRLGAGVLLALGPLFLAFLLFDATRGLFEGWLKALAGLALGSVAVALALGVEIALLEPWVATLASERAAGGAVPGAPVALLAATLVFALALAGLLGLSARVTARSSWPSLRSVLPTPAESAAGAGSRVGGSTSIPEADTVATGGRSRAARIAEGIAASQRREEQTLLATRGVGAATGTGSGATTTPLPTSAVTPLGRSFRRRTAVRVSASAGRRDRSK